MFSTLMLKLFLAKDPRSVDLFQHFDSGMQIKLIIYTQTPHSNEQTLGKSQYLNVSSSHAHIIMLSAVCVLHKPRQIGF